MNRPQVLATKSIDLASFIAAKTGKECRVMFSGSVASFEFPNDLETRDCLISYECGGEVEGRKLLEIRNQLFRRLKGGRP